MKKLFLPALLLCIGTAVQAQNKEVPPPPPPPDPPVVVEAVPPPPPPPKPPKAPQKTKKFTPPVIVKDEAAPPPPPPEIEVVKFASPSHKNVAAFYKRNPSVASLGWGPENRIIVRLKNKTIEKYDMSDPGQKKAFTGKYGDAPAPPPPPPLPPPAKPKKSPSTT